MNLSQVFLCKVENNFPSPLSRSHIDDLGSKLVFFKVIVRDGCLGPQKNWLGPSA